MPNPNPHIANLTNAGKGRPKSDSCRTQIHVSLTEKDLIQLDEYCKSEKIKRSIAIETAVKLLLGKFPFN